MTDKQVSAIQLGDQRIEYITPDLLMAYAQLAPLVTEARAYLKCGEHMGARIALDKARALIEALGMLAVVATSEQGSQPPPKTHRLWLNLYRPGGCVVNYSVRGSEILATLAADERGNCITRAFPVDIPEGYGLDNPDKEQ